MVEEPRDRDAVMGDQFDDHGFVDEEEAARRMGVSTARVRELVKRGVLRSRDGLVQTAIVSGAIG